jgi:serine/threonine protein kinase
MYRDRSIAPGANEQRLMTDAVPRAVGGRALVKPLSGSMFGQRFLALDPRRQVDCMIWLFDAVEADRLPGVWAYLQRAVDQRRPHVLQIDAAGRERGGLCWACTPYVGNHDDIVSLDSLRLSRGGTMTVFETARAVEQLIDATIRSHEIGIVHGAIDPNNVLVTPRGTLEISMYGLREALKSDEVPAEVRAGEIASIGGIAWQMLTGLDREESPGAAGHELVSHAWRRWIVSTRDPITGFESPTEALRALPSNIAEPAETRLGAARSILGRLSSAVGGTRSGRAAAEISNQDAAKPASERKKSRPTGVR